MGSSSVKTNPTPTASVAVEVTRSRALEKSLQVSGSVVEANAPDAGSTGIFVCFPSRSSARQQSHCSREVRVSGRLESVGIDSDIGCYFPLRWVEQNSSG